jgi:hypothetical protein
MPMGLSPDDLRAPVAELRELMSAAGRPDPEVAVFTRLPIDDAERARDLLSGYAAAGATRVIHGARYTDEAGYRRQVEAIGKLR